MPRLRLNLRKVLGKAQPPKPVTLREVPKSRHLEAFEASAIVQRSLFASESESAEGTVNLPNVQQQQQKQQKKPRADPDKYAPYTGELFERFESDVAAGRPHFGLGGKEQWFPWTPITLMQPSAKMTPWQAQFIVPRHFNRLDMRDYLWNIYGLRALSVSVQVLASPWLRSHGPRYRAAQKKKMIITMEQPFVWPEPDDDFRSAINLPMMEAQRKYSLEGTERVGSNVNKPSEVFNGVLGPYPEAPAPFVPLKLQRKLKNQLETTGKRDAKLEAQEKIKKYLGL